MAPLAASLADKQMVATASLTDFGGVGDGETDNADALKRAFSAIGPSGRLTIPKGRFLIRDTTLGSAPLVVPAKASIIGDGKDSILEFRREKIPALYGLTVAGDGIHLANLSLAVDTGGSGWTAAIGITRPIRDLWLDNVRFVGRGGRTGHIGILPLGVDLDNLRVTECHFERLDFGFTRQTSDTSIHRGLVFSDCSAFDCTEVLEFNSPGLLMIETTVGSREVSRVLDANGQDMDTRAVRLGQAIRSDAFPSGTIFVGRTPAGGLLANNAALRTTSPGYPARLSTGASIGGKVSNLRAVEIGQWAVGLANCADWDIEVYGREIGYELVHVEDGSSDIHIRTGGERCNLKPGVVGSPQAINGMVHVSTGSHDIVVDFATADLTKNPRDHPVALCVQAGGLMGTTGREIAPSRITVGGTVMLQAGGKGVVAFDSDLRFADLFLIGTDTDVLTAPMLRLPGCSISGSVKVHNGGDRLIQLEANRFRGAISIEHV